MFTLECRVSAGAAWRPMLSLLELGLLAGLVGCAGQSNWVGAAGPNREHVQEVRTLARVDGIQLVDVNDAVTKRLIASQKKLRFSDSFDSAAQPVSLVGAGDVVEVSIWESPPAVLFGSPVGDSRSLSSTTRVTGLPEQAVNSDGAINIPFAGQVPAAGRTPQQIEMDIAARLQSKANQPQVMLRVTKNVSSNVTVVGEVTASTRMPLSARGERLLDALAAAGGVRQSVGKMSLQITRGKLVQVMPLDAIIRDPLQNIVLQAGDVVTALHQPLSLVVLGATGRNEEVSFESQGISLAQALARAGGLQDARADARGVFIFRWEDAQAVDWTGKLVMSPEGRVPVIFQIDLKDPASFFVAQSFPITNGDVLYVSNAPAADLQKFVDIVGAVVSPLAYVRSVTR